MKATAGVVTGDHLVGEQGDAGLEAEDETVTCWFCATSSAPLAPIAIRWRRGGERSWRVALGCKPCRARMRPELRQPICACGGELHGPVVGTQRGDGEEADLVKCGACRSTRVIEWRTKRGRRPSTSVTRHREQLMLFGEAVSHG